MGTLNKVIIMGNLTREVDLKDVGGTQVADIGLAMNESYKNKEGEWVEKPIFVDVVVWGPQASTSAQYLSKGSPVLIEGGLQLDSWESKEGEKRSKLRVRANRVVFLGSRQDSQQESTPIPVGAGAGDNSDLPF